MQLPRDGQEYARIFFDELPTGAVIEASIDSRTTWQPTIPGDTDLERRFLVRGPDCTRTNGTLLPDNRVLWIRLVDSPETVVREAGTIWIQ